MKTNRSYFIINHFWRFIFRYGLGAGGRGAVGERVTGHSWVISVFGAASLNRRVPRAALLNSNLFSHIWAPLERGEQAPNYFLPAAARRALLKVLTLTSMQRALVTGNTAHSSSSCNGIFLLIVGYKWFAWPGPGQAALQTSCRTTVSWPQQPPVLAGYRGQYADQSQRALTDWEAISGPITGRHLSILIGSRAGQHRQEAGRRWEYF